MIQEGGGGSNFPLPNFFFFGVVEIISLVALKFSLRGGGSGGLANIKQIVAILI